LLSPSDLKSKKEYQISKIEMRRLPYKMLIRVKRLFFVSKMQACNLINILKCSKIILGNKLLSIILRNNLKIQDL
jgi:hypothetical protein